MIRRIPTSWSVFEMLCWWNGREAALTSFISPLCPQALYPLPYDPGILLSSFNFCSSGSAKNAATPLRTLSCRPRETPCLTICKNPNVVNAVRATCTTLSAAVEVAQ